LHHSNKLIHLIQIADSLPIALFCARLKNTREKKIHTLEENFPIFLSLISLCAINFPFGSLSQENLPIK
jgi:hypothetical protein